MSFFQEPPQLANQYTTDRALRLLLERCLPQDVLGAVQGDLENFGLRVTDDILDLCLAAQAQEPRLQQFDAWGNRIDEIHVSDAWKALGAIAAQEGLVALAYERPHGAASRICQAAKLYLFNPSSAIYTCPLAMSDGAARLIEVHGDATLKEKAYKHLISRDPKDVWTSGQWMTERAGGSDVSGTETMARPAEGGFELTGTKWFTSATTSQMAMTLARVEGDQALSLFYIETRLPSGHLNNIEIHRLKDKLGTRAMPTAELSLRNTPAQLVGTQGRGVAQMATLFNVTRIYNAITSVGYMRRGLALAADFAQRRQAFGRPLSQHPLHVRTLAGLQARLVASLHVVFYVTQLQGKLECDEASQDERAALRLLTPVAKLFTAKESVSVLSEVLECFGGAGYMEDNHLPVLLRDAQVLPIWEGTTNVLSLDALRSIQKDDAFTGWRSEMERKISGLHKGTDAETLREGVQWLHRQLADNDPEQLAVNARAWAITLAKITAAILLAEQGQWEQYTKSESMALGCLKVLTQKQWLQPEAVFEWDDTEHQIVYGQSK
ncbi:MAG: acyl-CoA dehydrogenase [Myxococcales bacterium]|nr:acyl-CoA dehydrogenase [Myxococcales bacterium]